MSDEYAEIRARFERETAKHVMTVLHDDGLYRHLRFMNPKHSAYWFELITVPHALIFRGDGESFVFSRLEDMFMFFRSGIRKDGSIEINPGYWDEKLTSDRDSATRYSEDRFKALVDEQLAEAEKTYPGVTAEWAEVTEDEYNLEYEADALRAVHEFSFGAHHKAVCSCGWSERFEFSWAAEQQANVHRCLGLSEHEVTVIRDHGFSFDPPERVDEIHDHYWWFLWACYGICWGIQQYDARPIPVRPAVRKLVSAVEAAAAKGPCWILSLTAMSALVGSGDGGPVFLGGFRRSTVTQAVDLGLIRLGGDKVDVPQYAGGGKNWEWDGGALLGRTVTVPAAVEAVTA